MSAQFKVGDKVTPDAALDGIPRDTIGRVFTVAKVNPKNLRCTADDGGRGINFPAFALKPATPENLSPQAGLRPFAAQEFYSSGEIVTLKRAWRDWTTETPLVVLADKGSKVNVTLLGGDNDRYLRVPHGGLVRRDAEWLAGALLDRATA